VTLTVTNPATGRSGSHYHFFETNSALKFSARSCMRARHRRRTAVRFERELGGDVTLVALAGSA
jgi:urease subunit beta